MGCYVLLSFAISLSQYTLATQQLSLAISLGQMTTDLEGIRIEEIEEISANITCVIDPKVIVNSETLVVGIGEEFVLF